jgi:hypothetical protein
LEEEILFEEIEAPPADTTSKPHCDDCDEA